MSCSTGVTEPLFKALFNFKDARAQGLLNTLYALPFGAELKICCSDDQVTLPLCFVYGYNEDVQNPTIVNRPSRNDFGGFSRYRAQRRSLLSWRPVLSM